MNNIEVLALVQKMYLFDFVLVSFIAIVLLFFKNKRIRKCSVLIIIVALFHLMMLFLIEIDKKYYLLCEEVISYSYYENSDEVIYGGIDWFGNFILCKNSKDEEILLNMKKVRLPQGERTATIVYAKYSRIIVLCQDTD